MWIGPEETGRGTTVALENRNMLLPLLLVLFHISIHSTTPAIIEELPGYPHILPFKLETGYIGVGEDDEIQLFYYFIESERDPEYDPLMLWFTGGPGCSGFSGLVYEIGPLRFDCKGIDGRFPSFEINPYSWTKIASIIFIDSPVGTGFSYATTSDGYATSDTKATKDNYTFLRKWLLDHPAFANNRLYITGDSYGGKIVPMVALEVIRGNEAGIEQQLFLQGYIIGNPVTFVSRDHNEQIPYAHGMALIPDEYFELAKSSCHGEYINPDPSNVQCLDALKLYHECIDHINPQNILEPQCHFVDERPVNHLVLSKQETPFCRCYAYLSSYHWANDETVQEALHVRKGTVSGWERCNRSIQHEKNVESVYEYHSILNEKGLQALVYSGDHDLAIPYLATMKWIRNLNLTIDEKWRPWTVNGQVAGYTERYMKKKAYLTYATVKGAGHTAPEDKPRQCLEMVDRWLNMYPL